MVTYKVFKFVSHKLYLGTDNDLCCFSGLGEPHLPHRQI